MANTKVQSEQIADDAVVTSHIADNVGLGGSPTTTTQSPSDNSTKIATTAYVDAAYAALVDSSPATLNTLNELAAALGDDANFSTTITNSIATKLPLAGGTMTGNIIMGDDTSIGIADDAERIEFDGAGDINILGANLGIGTTNPQGNLHVVGDTGSSGRIYVSDTDDGEGAGDSLLVNKSGASAYIYNRDSGRLNLGTNDDSDMVVIDSSGNVGIGTTSPEGITSGVTSLSISDVGSKTTDDKTGVLAFKTNDSSYTGTYSDGVTGEIYSIAESSTGAAYGLAFLTGTISGTDRAERMRINNSGNVGIGGTPQTTVGILDIVGQSNNYNTAPMLTFKTTSTNAANRNWSMGALDINYGDFHIGCGDSNSDFFDATAHSKFTINKDGKVGIGTPSPSAKLEVAGGSLDINGTDDLRLRFLNGGSFKAGIQVPTTSGDMITGSAVNDLAIRSGANMLFASGGATERMRIDSSGNVGIGITSPQSALHTHIASSGGKYHQFTNASTGSAGSDGWKIGIHDDENFIIWGQESTESFRVYNNGAYRFTIDHNGAVSVAGAFSKGSGSFKIDHPLEAKKDTHHLVHSFIEGPQADLIYRGKVDLVDGSATVNIDTVAGMTEGTFVALNTDVQCFTSNETDWDAVKGSVSGNTLTITCQNSSSTATVSWLVIGERHDQHMIDTEWTDDNGKVIVEPLKEGE